MLSRYLFPLDEERNQLIGLTSAQPRAVVFTRLDAQDMLDAAQIEVGYRYADIPDLRDALQSQLCQGIEDCNLRDVDPMQILHEQMRSERLILDAYNKHRLGKAAYRYYENIQKHEYAAEYHKEDNIPGQSEWFPLRFEIEKRGIHVEAAPIYQIPDTAEHSQRYSPKTSVPAKTPERVKLSAENVAREELLHKPKIGRAVENYDKLTDAPPADLEFPNGNILISEMAAFLPQSFKSWDVIDRTVHNGATSATIASLINHFRKMPHGPIENNSVYRMMKGPMNKRAMEDPRYKSWSVSKHHDIEKPEGFDPTSTSVAGFCAPVIFQRRRMSTTAVKSSPTIPFKELAEGIAVMPSGSDALDLTRCVKYCLAHPDEDWDYPVDFERLVNHIPPASGFTAGPEPVQIDNHDVSIVRRLTPPAKLQTRKLNVDCHLLKKQEYDLIEEASMIANADIASRKVVGYANAKRVRSTTTNYPDEEESPFTSRASKRRKFQARSRGKSCPQVPPSRFRTEMVSNEIDSDSDGDAYRGPTVRKKLSTPRRTFGRKSRFSGNYSIDAVLEVDDEETMNECSMAAE